MAVADYIDLLRAGTLSIGNEMENALAPPITVDDLFFILDEEGRVIWVNSAVMDRFGYPENGILGKNLLTDQLKEHDVPAVTILKGTLECREKMCTVPLRTKEGQNISVEARISEGEWKGSKVLFCLSKDMTERVRVEKELKRNEEFMRKIISTVPDIVVRTDLEGSIQYINDFALEISGFGIDEAIGRNMMEFLAPEDRKRAIENTRLMMDRRLGPREYDLLMKDGGRLPVEVNGDVLRLEDGTPYGLVHICRDLSDRISMKRAQKERENRYRRQQHAAIRFVMDPLMTCGELKRELERITETASEALGVERAGIWLLTEDGKELRCADLFESKARVHSEGHIIKADDHPEYFNAFRTEKAIGAEDARNDPRTKEFAENYLVPTGVTSMLDAAIHRDGKVIGVVCHEHRGNKRRWEADEVTFAGVVADQISQILINHEKKRSDELVKEERDKAKFYLDLMGHDIGNLHQGIYSAIQMAKFRIDEPKEGLRLLNIAEETLQRSLTLVKNIQIYSRIQSSDPAFERIDIASMIGSAKGHIEDVFPSKMVSISLQIPDQSIEVMAEPILEQAFFNIIHNGIKHHKGEIARIEIEIVKDDDAALMTFSDHGGGIPDNMKKEIFSRFTTREENMKSGSGLGLYIVKELVSRYKGTIEVADRVRDMPSEGAKFIVRIPLAGHDQ